LRENMALTIGRQRPTSNPVVQQALGRYCARVVLPRAERKE
jgi:hypothetical protein